MSVILFFATSDLSELEKISMNLVPVLQLQLSKSPFAAPFEQQDHLSYLGTSNMDLSAQMASADLTRAYADPDLRSTM